MKQLVSSQKSAGNNATAQKCSKSKELVKRLIAIEKEIFDLYSNPVRCPICNDDWTDAHQEYLEYTWAKEELEDEYQEIQKQWLKARKEENPAFKYRIKSAYECYEQQKRFNEECTEFFKSMKGKELR